MFFNDFTDGKLGNSKPYIFSILNYLYKGLILKMINFSEAKKETLKESKNLLILKNLKGRFKGSI